MIFGIYENALTEFSVQIKLFKMGKREDITIAEKQKITKLLSEEMSSLETLKKLCWSYQTINTVVESISTLRTQIKGKRI